MAKVSAGLVMLDGRGRVLLVHPGGPFFKKRDAGVWGIPKGMCGPGESPEAAARREFFEELGFAPPESVMFSLGSIKQSGGKTVHAWAFVGEWDPATLVSNEFELEWPPRSGKVLRFPEVDRAEFFDPDTAAAKIIPAQLPLIQRALAWLGNLPSSR